MADGSESSRRQDNSRVTSALITGAFGLMGTVVTIVAMRHSAPTEPPQAAVTLAAAPSTAGGPPTVVEPTGSVPPSNAAPTRSAGNPLLNFAEFQARLAQPGLSAEQRKHIVRPLLGQTVVWQGYVDAVTGMTAPTADAAITVTLVESPDKLNQSMFKSPAHFRFAPEALEEVAALAVGDRVILSGTLAEHYFIMTIVRDAHVMKVNGRLIGRAASRSEREATTH